MGVGALWNQTFPINENLWTSSFVLWAGGWSLLLLGLFYLVIDVWGWRKWAFFFVVIGANAITIYMACRFIDFAAVGKLLFGRAPSTKRCCPPPAWRWNGSSCMSSTAAGCSCGFSTAEE